MNLTPNSGIAAPPGGFMASVFATDAPPVAPTETVATPTEPTPPVETPAVVDPAVETPAEETIPDETLKALDAFNPDAKPDEVKPTEVEEEPPAGVRTKEAREAWKEGRIAIKKAAALEAEIAKLRETSGKLAEADPVRKENEAIAARNAELEKVVARVAFMKSKAYEEAVTIPRKEISADVLALGKLYEIPEDKIDAAFTERNPRKQNELLAEIAEGMDERAKMRLYNLADSWESIYNKEEDMARNAEAARKEADGLEAQEREKVSLARKAEEMRAVADLKPKLESVAKVFAKEGISPEAYAQQIMEKMHAVPFAEQPVGQQTYLTAAGLLLPEAFELIKSLKTQLAAKEKTVAAMSAASPRTSTGAPANSGDAKKTERLF